jgi:hypothetical protein
MTRDTSAKGDRTEYEIFTALIRCGHRLLRPLSSAARYDVAIDNGDGTIMRVQCKTGVLARGRIVFRVCSTDARRRQGIPYVGQVDAFGVFCPQTGKCYLVPIGDVADCRTMGTLRIAPTLNGQSLGVRHAAAFEINATP